VPGFEERLEDLPRQIDRVATIEERQISLHRVEQQRFVGGRRELAEGVAVREVHQHLADVHRRARRARAQFQRDTLIGLDPDREQVRLDLILGRVAKEPVRDPLELDRDEGQFLRHPLAGAEVERNICPPPVVDPQLECDEGFNTGVCGHAGFFAIGRHSLAADLAAPILAPDPHFRDPRRGDGDDGAKEVRLPITDRLSVVADRRLHRNQRHELKEVILEHVPQAAGFFVVTAPVLHAERLGGGDLHVVDVVPVPDRLDDRVGESERQDVLNGVLSEVVIDSVNLLLVQDTLDRRAEVAGAGQIAAERLLDDNPGPACGAAAAPCKSVPVKILDDGREEARGRRQIEEPVARAAVVRVHLAQPGGELLIALLTVEVRRDVVQARRELVPEFLAERQHVGRAFHAPLHLVAKPGVCDRRHGDADDGKSGREQLLTGEVVQRRHQLAAGQVAARAEDDESASIPGRLQERRCASGVHELRGDVSIRHVLRRPVRRVAVS
jgi:hypothetical protein